MTLACFEAVIVGGGPSGAAAAIALARAGRQVALFQATGPARYRIGETLQPATKSLLQALGVWEGFRADGHQPSSGIVSAWNSDRLHTRDHLFDPYGAGWHLDRLRFEAFLLDEAERAGATVYRQTRVISWTAELEGWVVRVANRRDPITARILIDASGRSASVARGLGARRQSEDSLVGVYALYQGDGSSADTRTLVEARPDGWWYSAGLFGGRWVAAFFTDVDFLPGGRLSLSVAWSHWIEASVHTRNRLYSASMTESPRVTAANTYRIRPAAGPGWLAIGDAAIAVDPLSSLGIPLALRSGIEVLTTVERMLDRASNAAAEAEHRVAWDFEEILRQRRHQYKAEYRWTTAEFWSRRRT